MEVNIFSLSVIMILRINFNLLKILRNRSGIYDDLNDKGDIEKGN